MSIAAETKHGTFVRLIKHFLLKAIFDQKADTAKTPRVSKKHSRCKTNYNFFLKEINIVSSGAVKDTFPSPMKSL